MIRRREESWQKRKMTVVRRIKRIKLSEEEEETCQKRKDKAVTRK